MRGGGLYEPMAETGLFPIAARQMIQVGERTGLLGNQLGKAASYYEREVAFAMKKATQLFEPVVILFVALDRRIHRHRPDRGDVQHLWPGQVRTDLATIPKRTPRVGISRHQHNKRKHEHPWQLNHPGHRTTVEQDDKGFTLIEILIAIVLVGILSAVAVVGISNLVSKGSNSACGASKDAATAAFAVWFANNGNTYPTTFTQLARGAGGLHCTVRCNSRRPDRDQRLGPDDVGGTATVAPTFVCT